MLPFDWIRFVLSLLVRWCKISLSCSFLQQLRVLVDVADDLALERPNSVVLEPRVHWYRSYGSVKLSRYKFHAPNGIVIRMLRVKDVPLIYLHTVLVLEAGVLHRVHISVLERTDEDVIVRHYELSQVIAIEPELNLSHFTLHYSVIRLGSLTTCPGPDRYY